MSDVNPTRRTDEPPTRDGAPLAGWSTVITAEEAAALRGALGQLQAALDAVVRDRDEALAEIECLREALVRGSEVLACHQGSLEREWHTAGAWLYARDTINVVRAPMPEIEVVS